jgi:SsrA-binding protein
MAKRKGQSDSPTIENRRARHDYHIGDTLEVGIVLQGSVVKSVRDGKASLADGYVRAVEEPPELMLHGVHIDEYAPAAGVHQHDPRRNRVLLAHKKQIRKFARDAMQKGVTIVPLKMYFKDGRAKLLIGLATGKAEYDKRQDVQKREADRDIRRAMSKRI